jgi:hypothetical protein
LVDFNVDSPTERVGFQLNGSVFTEQVGSRANYHRHNLHEDRHEIEVSLLDSKLERSCTDLLLLAANAGQRQNRCCQTGSGVVATAASG